MTSRITTPQADPSEFFYRHEEEKMRDPLYRRGAVLEAVRIANIESILETLDEARRELELSKEEIARRIEAHGSVVRRLFSSPEASPSLRSISDVAAAVGMRVELVPMSEKERLVVIEALGTPAAADPTKRNAPNRSPKNAAKRAPYLRKVASKGRPTGKVASRQKAMAKKP
jgi:DNA-binding phage protein